MNPEQLLKCIEALVMIKTNQSSIVDLRKCERTSYWGGAGRPPLIYCKSVCFIIPHHAAGYIKTYTDPSFKGGAACSAISQWAIISVWAVESETAWQINTTFPVCSESTNIPRGSQRDNCTWAWYSAGALSVSAGGHIYPQLIHITSDDMSVKVCSQYDTE